MKKKAYIFVLIIIFCLFAIEGFVYAKYKLTKNLEEVTFKTSPFYLNAETDNSIVGLNDNKASIVLTLNNYSSSTQYNTRDTKYEISLQDTSKFSISVTDSNNGVIKSGANSNKIQIDFTPNENVTLNSNENVILLIKSTEPYSKEISKKIIISDSEETIALTDTNGNEYTWAELSAVATQIKNDSNVDSSSYSAGPYTINNKSLTLTVGDEAVVTDKSKKKYRVRILGFNTDNLADGSGKAGISFEFIDFLTTTYMNSKNTNEKGWGETDLRANLNGGTKHDGTTTVSEGSALVSTLKNASYIKSVSKKYIQTYNDANSITTCNDKLWLLADGEIWNNGYLKSSTFSTPDRGYAITDESPEGKQYAYYEKNLKNARFDQSSTFTQKYSSSTAASASRWWLRSPRYSADYRFCGVTPEGGGSYTYDARAEVGVAPGFAI